MWNVLIAIILIFWIPHRAEPVDYNGPAPESRKTWFSSGFTWYIVLYLGLRSLFYYTVVTWLSVMLQSKGMTPIERDWSTLRTLSSASLGRCCSQ